MIRLADMEARRFVVDGKVQRMQDVLSYYFTKYGCGNKTFKKWRTIYLKYIEKKYPNLYNKKIES